MTNDAFRLAAGVTLRWNTIGITVADIIEENMIAEIL